MTASLEHHDRLGVFDLMRFLAAAMVVLLHHGVWDAMTLNSPLAVDPWLADIVKYGKFGVDVFFVISGYFVFLTADGRGWKDFAIARFSRLYPAFLICCTITFAVVTLWGNLPAPEMPRLRNYLGNVGLASFVTGFLPGFNGAGYVDGVYWTLAYELVWYLLVAAYLMRGTVEHGQRFLLGLCGLSTLLWVVLWSGRNERIGQIGQFLAYFVLGAQMYMLSRYRPTALGWACFWYSAALVGLSVWFRAVGGLVHVPHLLTWDPFISLALVGGSVAVMWLAATGRVRIGGALVTVLGASTYPLYLIHDKAGVVLAQHLPWMRGWPGLLVLLVICVATTCLFARYAEPALIVRTRDGLRRLLGVAKPVRTPMAGSALAAQAEQQKGRQDAAEPGAEAASPAAASGS